MSARVRWGVQGIAVAAVLGLLVLLVWKIANDERSEVPRTLEGRSIEAPDFALPRLDGEGELSLASLRGKAVVVNFWASWCEPCKTETPMLQAAWRKYRSQGLVIVGIDYDDFRGEARAFAKRYGVTYPIVHDRRKETVGRYGVVGVPETLFVDRRGRLVGERVVGELDEGELDANIALALKRA
jgi:cytochrome c biogenesis protein CcmG, thiol:disulfide interchange protein DsbE